MISTAKPPWSPPQVADPPLVVATTPEQARELVEKQALLKPDFIKIWFMPAVMSQQQLPVVEAAIDEAHRRHLRVAVHAQELESARAAVQAGADVLRSEEHTSELQSLMRISYAVFCLKKKKKK